MNMVRHQYIGMNIALMLFTSLLEPIKIKPVVISRVKNSLSVIPTNDNVLRVAGINEAGKSGHTKVDLIGG